MESPGNPGKHEDGGEPMTIGEKILHGGGDLIDAPEEFGGLDLSKTTSMLAAEKASIYGGFSVAYTAHSGIGTLPLVYYGTKGQKERYLGKIIHGEWVG